jgi:hypothetical protein
MPVLAVLAQATSLLADNRKFLHQIADGNQQNKASFSHGKCRFTYSMMTADSEQDALNGKWNDVKKPLTSEFLLFFRDDALTVKLTIGPDELRQKLARRETVIYPESYAQKGKFAIDFDPFIGTSILYSPANKRLNVRMHPFNLAVDSSGCDPESTIAYAEKQKFEGIDFGVEENVMRGDHKYLMLKSAAKNDSHDMTFYLDPQKGYLPFITEEFAKNGTRDLFARMSLLKVHREGDRYFPIHAIRTCPRKPTRGPTYVSVREMKVVEFDLNYHPTPEDLSLQLPKDTQFSDGVNPKTAKSLFRDGLPGIAQVSVDDLEGIYNLLQNIAAERAQNE